MYQKITIVGNLGRDPEMRYMPDGTAVTNFSVATSRTWTNRATGEKEEETAWFRVGVWGRQAEACNQYLARGRKVLVDGSLVPDRATGGPKTFQRQDGTIGASFEIRADTVRFLSSKNEDGGAAGAAVSANGANGAGGYDFGNVPTEEDEIPF